MTLLFFIDTALVFSMMWSLCCKVANHDVNDFNSLNEMFPAYKKFIHDGQHSKEIEKMILRLLTLLSWQNDIGDNSSTSPIAAKSLIQVSQDLVNVLLLPKEVKNCIIIATFVLFLLQLLHVIYCNFTLNFFVLSGEIETDL